MLLRLINGRAKIVDRRRYLDFAENLVLGHGSQSES